ncbi:hypothetical protein GW17_00025303, partial [Ensete ventricosum]
RQHRCGCLAASNDDMVYSHYDTTDHNEECIVDLIPTCASLIICNTFRIGRSLIYLD